MSSVISAWPTLDEIQAAITATTEALLDPKEGLIARSTWIPVSTEAIDTVATA